MAVAITNKKVKETRLDMLRKKHKDLSEKIEKDQQDLSCSDLYIRSLKSKKLRIKEEIESITEVA